MTGKVLQESQLVQLPALSEKIASGNSSPLLPVGVSTNPVHSLQHVLEQAELRLFAQQP